MRTIVTTLLASAVSLGALAAAHADAPSQAAALLEKVAAAYRNAPAITDTVSMTFRVGGSQQQVDFEYALGRGSDAYLHINGMMSTAVGGSFYLTKDDVPTKYIRLELEGNLSDTFRKAFGQQMMLPVQMSMRTDREVAARLDSFGLGVIRNLRIDDYRMATQKDGSTRHEVSFVGDNGTLVLSIAPDNMLIWGMRFGFSVPGAPPDAQVTGDITFNPKIMAALPKKIAFDPSNRLEVKSVQDFDHLVPGELAPDFTLTTIDGRVVRLSALRGSVVVLDFWATWCPPCVKALPLLQKFATSAEASGQPIEVYGVNVRERLRTADQKRKRVADFWRARGYTMPTLLDLDDSVSRAYQVGGIPTTVIVGPDGRVFKVHVGYDVNLVKTLTDETLAALDGRG